MARFRVLVSVMALLATAAAASAAEMDGQIAVSDVRVGVHPGITRVVLDMSGPARFAHEVSGDGQAVLVNIPEARWRAGALSGRHLRGAIAELKVSDDGRLAILTDGPVHVQRAFALGPSGNAGHRIVIDLADGLGPEMAAAPRAPMSPLPANVQPAAFRPVPDAGSFNREAVRVPPPAPPRVAMTAPPPAVAQPQPVTQRWGTPAPASRSAPVEVAQARQADGMGQRMFGVTSIYARGHAGMGFLNDADTSGAGNQAQVEFDLGYVLGGAIGAELDNGFRVEAEMTYAANDLDTLAGTAAGGAFSTGKVNGSMSSLAMMSNLAYDFNTGMGFKPFLLGGVGLVRIAVSDVSIAGTPIADDTDWVFGYQLGAGVKYDLTDRVGVEASYRFVDTLDPSFSDARGVQFDAEYRNHQFLFGAYFNF